MSNIWFTSDWHLGHANIITHCNRPFVNAHEMDKTILKNHNDLVEPGDVVYHHGDIFFKMGYDQASNLFSQFNGLFHIIIGNHDKFSFLKRLKEDNLIKSYQDVLGVDINGQYIWMSHYPHRSWNKAFHGSWHTFGHVHGRLDPYPSGRSVDVGVDSWDYKPVSFDDLSERMQINYDKSKIKVE